jgi:hypothetical protein
MSVCDEQINLLTDRYSGSGSRVPLTATPAGCNDPVLSVDMAIMGKVTGKIAATLAASALMATAGVVAAQGTAAAEPTGHKVVYTVTTAAPYDFELTYLTTQPANKAAYNADAYTYLKRERLTLVPDVPWVFETTLEDPQWGYLGVSSTARGGMAQPNARCTVTVDGEVVRDQEAPYSPFCLLGQW